MLHPLYNNIYNLTQKKSTEKHQTFRIHSVSLKLSNTQFIRVTYLLLKQHFLIPLISALRDDYTI